MSESQTKSHTRIDTNDLLVGLGLLLLFGGVALFSIPLAMILAAVVLIGTGVLGARDRSWRNLAGPDKEDAC